MPCEMSRKIYKAAKEMITFETFPGAGHGMSYMADMERYERIVTEFMRNVIPEK